MKAQPEHAHVSVEAAAATAATWIYRRATPPVARPFGRRSTKGTSMLYDSCCALADVNAGAENISSLTPLASAAQNGHKAVVRELLARAVVDSVERDTSI